MKTLSKIAILTHKDANLTFELEELQNTLKKSGITSQIFFDSDSILIYKPDCVFITSAQEGRLTPYPTYGLLNKPRGDYLEIPRFVRNILSYDGYFTFSPVLKQTLGDLMFGARKLGTGVLKLDFFPAATQFKQPVMNADSPRIVIFEPDLNTSKFKSAIFLIAKQLPNVSVATFSVPTTNISNKIILAKNSEHLSEILHTAGIVCCLNSGDQLEATVTPAVIKAIASSTPTITLKTDVLESYFGDNLHYLDTNTLINDLPAKISALVAEIHAQPELASAKARNAHDVFLKNFAMDKLFEDFKLFHQKTLVNKGYVPNPDPAIEAKLPSVTYIIRTGGKYRHFLERTLTCLLEQQYPDMRAIFVVHAEFPYMDEIIAKYPSLRIKVIKSLKSMRAQAIRDGMAAVETDLFGLFDDDDEIFPNHVRMLVKTLQYNANRDWRGEISMVYSGSIHADDTLAVPERVEFQDHKLVSKNEKRCIEHFRFYSSSLMSQHTWFMPNGWLIRSKFIDDEILTDPQLDTCEDLYFELQIAQRGHFAFSPEVTTIHHFHRFGNSTIVDNYKHFPDTQRIALRNFSRVFPRDVVYDIAEAFRLIGKPSPVLPKQIMYQDDVIVPAKPDYSANQFYPARGQEMAIAQHTYIQQIQPQRLLTLRNTMRLPRVSMKLMRYGFKFLLLDNTKKKIWIEKFMQIQRSQGSTAAIKKLIQFYRNRNRVFISDPTKEYLLQRIFKKCFGLLRLIKSSVKKT
jgi:hypothetical protein